ncbi:MAG: YCF48-related protein [Syntrophomonadaceae bacterium]
MKKTIILFILLSFTMPLLAQHTLTQIRKPPFPGDIQKMIMAGNKLFAVGERLNVESFVAVSEDKGISWNLTPSQPFRAKDNLTSGFFSDENNGWVGGGKGILYKTTNGGASWQEKTDTLVYSGTVDDIYFTNSDTGFICGNLGKNGRVTKTVDGGKSWTAVSTPTVPDVDFTAMKWENSSKGFVIGDKGSIMVTTDGGLNWDATANKTGSKLSLFGIAKPDSGKYFICGSSGRILKSTDNGISFTLDTTVESNSLYSIVFLNSSEGMISGFNGAAYKTTDGGEKWTKIPVFTNDQLNSILPLDNGNITAAGNNGIFFLSSDKGATWTTSTLSSRDYYSVIAHDSMNIIVAGGSSKEGEINITHDGGGSWQKMPLVTTGLVPTNSPLRSIFAVGNDLYTCGDKGSFYFSPNNGSTWETHSPGGTSKSFKLFFNDENNGYMVTSDSRILKTTDKGTTWTQAAKFTGEMRDIKMLSTSRGFVAGGGDKLYETFDGNTWSHDSLASPNVNLNGIFMLNLQQGFVCGQNGAVFKTNDGLKTLELLTDTLALKGIQINDVFAMNDSTVWAVADKGLILRSSSANSMTVVDTAFIGENLTSIAKLNSSSIAVCGALGSLYKITDANGSTVGVKPELKIAESFDLKQNYPNPFNPETVISYSLASAGYVKLAVFDVLGKEVAVLEDGFKPAGNYSSRFNALSHNLGSGIYFYRLQAGKFLLTRKMMLIK